MTAPGEGVGEPVLSASEGTPDPQVVDLAKRLVAGDRRALARAITLVENASPEGRQLLALLYPQSGNAHVVGVTGPGGAGKSTLTSALAVELRKRGRSVGIVAVDPSSPFTHGALLGDRIRMQELTKDPGVFVRSMATRGELGGLAAMTSEVVVCLDAAKKDVVIVETVGAGQDEVEVASVAETTVVVLTPASGDDVQAMKAGVMEIADILVVNKADLPGADALCAQLLALINMASRGRLDIPVLRTIASKREGVTELADAIDEHRRRLASSGVLEQHRLERARRQLLAVVRSTLLERAVRTGEQNGLLDQLVRAVAARELDPYTAAQRLVEAGS
ncbi:MAG: methylmalonyl Co-A mutase-associated GTPase MeaB [Dehalococcoidia bacterium]